MGFGQARWWLLLAAGVAAFLILRRRPPRHTGDVVPPDPRRQRSMVDQASEDSFPASDPPSYWGRDTG
jgi:hypothetical protein